VLEWSIADERWDFALAEQAFGEEGAWESLVLSRAGVRVALRGRVDRVDVAHDSGEVRVIDYKTKERSAESHTAALGATRFQIALYGRVAGAAMARAGAEGLYLGLQRLRPGGAPKRHEERWAEVHELTDGVPGFERRVLDLVGELRRGEVAVRPYEAASCAHCDFDGVCRKPRFAPAAPLDESETDDAR
jgi:ATP-dependent helicase/DNAse subunit B